MPPSVHAPWHDGSTTRPEPVLERHRLHVARRVDQPQPDAVRREAERRRPAVVGARTATATDTATTSSPARSTTALSRRGASRSATSDPAPASSTIISRTPESASSPRSQRSWIRGSRVVRLMKTRPCVRNAAAIASRARREVVRVCTHGEHRGRPPAARGRLADMSSSGWVPSSGWSGTARRSGAATAAHLDHRPAAHRRSVRRPRRRWRPGWPTSAFDLVLTSPRQRARRTAELAGFPDAEVDDDLVEWAYGDYEGITTDEIRETVPGWTVWTHPVAGRRDRRRGLRPAGPRRRASTGPRPHPRLRARPLAARAHRALGRAAGRRGPVLQARHRRPCRCWASSASTRRC